MMVEELRSGALVPVLSEFLPHQFAIEALYPNREHLPAKVRTFIDLIAKNLHQMDWDCCVHADKVTVKATQSAALGMRTLLRTPGQPFCPLKAVEAIVCP